MSGGRWHNDDVDRPLIGGARHEDDVGRTLVASNQRGDGDGRLSDDGMQHVGNVGRHP